MSKTPVEAKAISSCPLCDSEAWVGQCVQHDWRYSVYCGNFKCGIDLESRQIEGQYETKDELIARWNSFPRGINRKITRQWEAFEQRHEALEKQICVFLEAYYALDKTD